MNDLELERRKKIIEEWKALSELIDSKYAELEQLEKKYKELGMEMFKMVYPDEFWEKKG